jgi:hypothetical protein
MGYGTFRMTKNKMFRNWNRGRLPGMSNQLRGLTNAVKPHVNISSLWPINTFVCSSSRDGKAGCS